MNRLNVSYIGTDQNWQDETTIHWFEVLGESHGHGIKLDGVYGWADNNGHISILDADGCPLTNGDGETEAARLAIRSTAETLTECLDR